MKLLKSFFYAFAGILHCIYQERNFRIHLTAVITVFLFSLIYGLELQQYPPLILVMVLVLATEAINTAIERAVDLESPTRHPLARVAKDSAAAAVLIAAMGSIAIAICTFSDLEKWRILLDKLLTPWPIAGVLAYIAVFAYFVFGTKIDKKF